MSVNQHGDALSEEMGVTYAIRGPWLAKHRFAAEV
jgi:hypothetical protein